MAAKGPLFNVANLGKTAQFTFGRGFKVVNGVLEIDLEPKSALHFNARDKVDFAFNAPFELQSNSPLALGVNLTGFLTKQKGLGATQGGGSGGVIQPTPASVDAILRGVKMRSWQGGW